MVKPESERLRTTYASDENFDPAGSALKRERWRSIKYSSSSQTSLTIQETRAVHPYNFKCPGVSSADKMGKLKF